MNREEVIINEILLWIDEHIQSPLKIIQVSSRAGYSRWHFQRMFYRITQKPLAQYIRNRRLECAARDIIMTSDHIGDIADVYGFDSQQSFTRAFLRKYSVTPGVFRKMNGNP